MVTVKKDAFGEQIAKKLSGFCGVPAIEQERMIQSVVKVCKEYFTKPTGLVKVEKCTNCRDGDYWYQAHAGKNINLHDCPRCKGEGFIRTDLTADEAVEVLKGIIIDQMHIMLIPPDGIELHNGSRIELKEELYPCKDCGKLRTAAEGGTTFTVCDSCWDKKYKKEKP